tara:strand:+ start:1311 stop:2312 length:1002 start_codon:yes stop_codon:yes gene_type:complete
MGWTDDLGGLLAGAGTIYGLSQLGKGPTPSAGQTTEQAFKAYQDYYPSRTQAQIDAGEGTPGYAEIVRSEQLRDLEHMQSPAMQELARRKAAQQFGLAQQYVPEYGQLASDEAYRTAMRDTGQQVDVLRGPGGELIDEAYAAAQGVDPEFYRQRAQTGSGLSDLLRSMYDERTLKGGDKYDESRPQGYFTGNLSGGEREEINRSLNQQATQAGNLNVPSMGNVVANAMTYGNAMQNRRNAFGQALQQATSFLPASRSGFDPMQVALGRPSTTLPTTFSQPNMQTNTSGQSGNFMNNTFGAAGQSAGFKANQPSWLDRIGQGVNVAGNIGKLGW